MHNAQLTKRKTRHIDDIKMYNSNNSNNNPVKHASLPPPQDNTTSSTVMYTLPSSTTLAQPISDDPLLLPEEYVANEEAYEEQTACNNSPVKHTLLSCPQDDTTSSTVTLTLPSPATPEDLVQTPEEHAITDETEEERIEEPLSTRPQRNRTNTSDTLYKDFVCKFLTFVRSVVVSET